MLKNVMLKTKTSAGNPPVTVPKDFLTKLGEMHTAERELTAALPLMVAAAKSRDLETLLRIHLEETRGHVKAVARVAEHLDRRLPTKRCAPMTKLIGEGVKVIGKRLVSSEQDLALIAVGRRIEQFEVDSYQELCATAKRAGLTHELALLTSILTQEELAHELLGQLAAGKGPLKALVENASLKRAGARSK